MKALSLFSGIGGLDLAAEMAGIKVVAFCEIEPYPISILEKRYPGIPIYNDIRQLKGSDFNDRIDIIHGGFPCQDLSQAGKQAGLEGARSGLWFEMLRIISEVRPRFVLAENVRGAVNLALDTVYSGLVGEGYKVYPYVIPASAVGAPHQRERLFVVGVRKDVADTYAERLEGRECASLQECPGEQLAREGGALWPTPSVHGNYNRAGVSDKSWNGLSTAVKLWPTPREFMYKDSIVDRGKGNIGEKVGGQLNPDWVEQLMNFPEGWTDLDVDEPREWAGWPALLGDRLWGTHIATASCRSKRFLENANSAMTPVEFVSKGEESSQYPYEFPRTTTGCKNRAKRLKALGNAVVPAQAYPFFKAIAKIERMTKENNK